MDSNNKQFFISPVTRAEAEGELAELYEEIAGTGHEVAHIMSITGQNPRALAAHYQMYRATMFRPSPLSRTQRELIAVAVSRSNGCHY